MCVYRPIYRYTYINLPRVARAVLPRHLNGKHRDLLDSISYLVVVVVVARRRLTDEIQKKTHTTDRKRDRGNGTTAILAAVQSCCNISFTFLFTAIARASRVALDSFRLARGVCTAARPITCTFNGRALAHKLFSHKKYTYAQHSTYTIYTYIFVFYFLQTHTHTHSLTTCAQ